MIKKIILVGYGNPDRQDDGIAWYILEKIATLRNLQLYEGIPDLNTLKHKQLCLLVNLQLVPEIAEILAFYDYACFVDAHTGNIPQDFQVIPLQANYQESPFTHHMTPQTCLELANALYGNSPKSILVSVRGYSFGFTRDLSLQSSSLAQQAIAYINDWIHGLMTDDNLPQR